MLVQLIYASVVADSSAAAVDTILAQGRRHNEERGITGVLCHGYGVFLQAIEGERAAVNQTYAQVLRDARHRDAQLLYFGEICERNFSNWWLGQVRLEKLSPPFVLKYVERLPLTPGQLCGTSARAMVLDLVATAAVAHR
ncbi:blue light sensor protein [Lampropedia cohaerens]|uniref:Blue light sensor protein n=1 Tax=Lampropedia cohaerens TaxID=1610491 RepID=A0A0U1Q1B7_9BURK|nr:BLUF domain-containing protein [Lampropedia cohaerens]KKW68564.1 blue light sensor protein [Lampropedia cohaerens]